jgi:hypothetical protein
VYSALQYGHFAQPVFSIGRKTRGCEFQRCIPGIGHDNGRSAPVTTYWFLALGSFSLPADSGVLMDAVPILDRQRWDYHTRDDRS